MAVSLVITDRASDGSDALTHTFTDRAIGPADATRTVLVGISTRSGVIPTITSVTIGGNAAAALVTARAPPNIGIAAIYALTVPTGTTATIVVNWSNTSQRTQIIVASLTGDYEATPLDTSAVNPADSAVDFDADLSLDVANGGAAFFVGCGATVATLDLSWTAGATGDTQQAVEALRTLAATLAPVATESPRTVTLRYDTTGGDVLSPAAVGVSFAPAGDVTAPVLSNPTAAATGQTTADLAVDTDEGNGTLYWVVTQSATPPSGAQVAAGQDHTGAAAAASGSQAVAGTGTQNISGGAIGLTEGTTYWAHFVQDDAEANRSNVASSGSFTTDAAPEPEPGPPAGGGGGGSIPRRQRASPRTKSTGLQWINTEKELADAKKRREEEAWREAAERALMEARLANIEREQEEDRERARLAKAAVVPPAPVAQPPTIIEPVKAPPPPPKVDPPRIVPKVAAVPVVASPPAPAAVVASPVTVVVDPIDALLAAQREMMAMLKDMREEMAQMRRALERATAENAKLKRNAQALEALLMAA